MENRKTAQSRRDFIKKGVTGVAGAAIIPSLIEKNRISKTLQPKKIITRTLGKTGVKLPVLSIGAHSYDKTFYEAALDSGIKHIDTSQYYYQGRHERVIGEVLKGKKRDSIFIATSILIMVRGDQNSDSFVERMKTWEFVEKFNSSLERLGTDYVDVFYIAGISGKRTAVLDEFLNGLEKLKKDGKVRFTGVATHRGQAEVLNASVDNKVHDVILVQQNYLQPNKEEIKTAIANAAKAGIGLVAMKTQAGGRGVTNHVAALKWVLQDKNICTAIPGMKSLDELKQNLAVMENLEFTAEEKAAVEGSGGASALNVFCANCEKCIPQCPHNVDIPSLMRSYMYAYGHKNIWMAKENLKSIDLSGIACNNCTDCSVKCTMGFDIQDKVKNMHWIKSVPEEFIL